MSQLVLDPARSHVRIHTFATGLLARLAHDLELVCRDVQGGGELTSPDSGTAAITVPIGKIDVAGTLRSGAVDANALSPSDRADVLEKMRRDVFHVSDGVVRLEATLAAGKGRVRVIPPKGRTLERSVEVRVVAEGGATRVSGRLEISLDAIGSDPVKGPMNAFRVKDGVAVLFELVFAPTSA